MKYKNLTKLKQCVILIILLNFITTVESNKKYIKSFDKILKKIDGKLINKSFIKCKNRNLFIIEKKEKTQ